VTVGQNQASMTVIWHDLECGAYVEDLGVWHELAVEHGDPVLDVGAGTGRIALDLARRGHEVTALDRDPVLIAELERRAAGLDVATVVADARRFELGRRFPLIIVPMQTIQLLGGQRGRQQFLIAAAGHLLPGGVLAVAISEMLESFSLEEGIRPPTPDMREIDGIVYSSQPTAVREDSDGFVLERLRERIGTHGDRESELDLIRLDRLTASQFEREALAAKLKLLGRRVVPATDEYVGSVVVNLGG
jgi:SAM-dependent methyltransferase